MNLTAEQLLDAVLALPEEERLEFAEALVVSLLPDEQPPFDDSWREISRRRADELVTGRVAAIPWVEVKRHDRDQADA